MWLQILKFAIMNTQWKRPLEGLYERDNCLSRGDGQTDARQHIVFDRTQHNGVYRRVMEKVPMVEEAGKWAELFIGWNRPVMPLSGLK